MSVCLIKLKAPCFLGRGPFCHACCKRHACNVSLEAVKEEFAKYLRKDKERKQQGVGVMYLVICSDKRDGFIYQTDGPFNSYAEAGRYSRESACKNHHVIVDVEELRLICDNRIFAASRKPMS